VRDDHFADLLEEYGRSILGKGLPDDPTVARVIARAVGVTKALSSPRHLSVPDAKSLKEFLKHAKQVYVKAHPPKEPKKRGRHPDENEAMASLMQLEQDLGRRSTFTEKKDRLSKFSKNTRERYERLFRLWKQVGQGWSEKDKVWLHDNYGKEALTLEWWLNRWWQWREASTSYSRLGEEIRKIFSMSPQEIQKERKRQERQRLQLLKR
jgi:hypothetical protein